MLTTIIGIDPRFEFSSTQQAVWCRDGPFPMHPFRFNQEIPRSLLRGYLAKGRGGRNRGVSPTMPFRLIPRSLLRGGFILHAAGIDVGADAHWVAVPKDRDEQPVQQFG